MNWRRQQNRLRCGLSLPLGLLQQLTRTHLTGRCFWTKPEAPCRYDAAMIYWAGLACSACIWNTTAAAIVADAIVADATAVYYLCGIARRQQWTNNGPTCSTAYKQHNEWPSHGHRWFSRLEWVESLESLNLWPLSFELKMSWQARM